MKSVFLFFAFIASGIPVYGQGDYRPLLKEGKVWQEHISSRPDYKWVHTYSIDGDTLIDGEKYYKLYKQTSLYTITQMGAEPELETAYDIQYETALKEDAGRVYSHHNGNTSLLYDFNLKAGDIAFETNLSITSVTKVDTIIVGGNKYRRLWLTETYKSNSQVKYTGYWVEGIGSIYGIMTSHGWDAIPISLLDGCYEDGALIFSADDFNDLANTEPVDNESYRPLVEEGKHWTYDNFMPLRPAKYDHYYYYDLRGDTLIAGKNCLKMYSENQYNDSITRYEGALYEEYKKVYCFYPNKDEAKLLYDFDCEVGDTLHVSAGQMVVKDIRTEDNGDFVIRKYILQWSEVYEDINYREEYDIIWIEGVGATSDFFDMLPFPGNYNSLNACELNDEKLYQKVEPDYTDKGYHKMGIEGKRWNYIHYYLDEDGEHRAPYSYVVKGDTIIRRTTYKKLWYQDEKTERLVCLLLEQGREVLKSLDFGDNSYDMPLMKSFFAFDREDFGRVFTWKAENNSGNTNWMVYGVDTIEVKGQPFRRYTCLQKYSEEGEKLTTIDYDGEGVWHDIWVEGVGSASSGIEDQIPSHEPPVRTPGEYTYFVSCYEDGKCIFTADDFNELTNPNHADNIAYRPMVEEGKVWKVGDYSGNPVQRVEYYYFDGDTIIDGRTCKQMMRQRYVSTDFPEYDFYSQQPSLDYVGAWYEEDKKVYEYDTTSKQFKLMYDFSIDANGIFIINEDYPPYVVGPRQTGGIKGFKGVYRDIMMSGDDESTYNTTWLEGIGNIDGPIYSVYYGKEGHALFLMSCTVGDEVIYLNDDYEDGATPEEARKRIDFTHTIKTKPKAPRREPTPDPSQGEGNQLYGEYNNLLLDINLDPLDDAYTVRITDETGKAVYEKAINAASIVGLNIDISTYPAGRYTVTVENSLESFIGVFETVTTGISDVNDNGEMTNDNIYNLHGQRINTLQKGLNIVNGQKVYVK